MEVYITEAHRKRPPVMVINGHAGGLTVAAVAQGHPIIASLEEVDDRGLHIQRGNFKGIDYRSSYNFWFYSPKRFREVEDGLVIAQPGNVSDIIDCALGSGCRVLMLEMPMDQVDRVQIRAAHQAGCNGYRGYHHYKILLNSVTFGTPQWSERGWLVFIRKDIMLEKHDQALIVQHTPVVMRVRDVLEDGHRGEKIEPRGRMEVLDPAWVAPTMTPRSFWIVRGRAMTDLEYRRIMGFPDVYRIPEKGARLRGYLARGVCPPVAAWLLDMVDRNIDTPKSRRSFYSGRATTRLRDECFYLSPGMVADLRPPIDLWRKTLASERGST